MSTVLKAEVVIVGAGFSGMRAAVDVTKAGLTCYVVEALDRIGGKVFTKPLTSGRGHVEMGATWIDGSTQKRMSALVEKYDVETRVQSIKGDIVTLDFDGQLHKAKHGDLPASIGPQETETYKRVTDLIQSEKDKFNPNTPGSFEEPPNGGDSSLEEWLQRNGADPGRFTFQAVRHFCKGVFGSEPNHVGAFEFLEMVKSCVDWHNANSDDRGGAQHLRFPKGTSSILQHMAAELRPNSVLLGKAVAEIHQAPDACIVSTRTGTTILCSRVVLTAPSNTWGEIKFSPPLPPPKQLLASKAQGGPYTKMVLTYSEPWWRRFDLMGKFHAWKGPISYTWDISDENLGQYSIPAFVMSETQLQFAKWPAPRRLRAVLDCLADMVPDEARSFVYDVLEVNEQDWHSPRSVQGACYPCLGPGMLEVVGPSMKVPFDSIHFAGTEMASHWRGYMEGAVESGERAAAEVIRSLKRE